MKKKIIAIMFAVSVLCLTTACGSQDVTGEVKETVVETLDEETLAEDQQNLEESEEASDESDENDADETLTNEEVSDEAEDTGDSEITMGINTESSYENDYFKIGCKLDSEWKFESQESILERNKLTAELVDEKFAKAFENGTVITDMVATNVNGMDTVNVGIEKLSGVNMLIDEKNYVELSAPQMEEALSSMGLQNIVTTVGESDFAGSSHYNVLVEAEYSGVPVYEKVAVIKNKSYMCVVTVCTWNENKTDEILSNFYGIQ